MKLIQPQKSYSKRHYHVYGISEKLLGLTCHELKKQKEGLLKAQKDSIDRGQITLTTFMKKTKTTPHFSNLFEVEKRLDACTNLQKLCEQAYELGKKVRQENIKRLPNDMVISEYLYDFICLTNEHYPCYQKEDFEKIKKLLS